MALQNRLNGCCPCRCAMIGSWASLAATTTLAGLRYFGGSKDAWILVPHTMSPPKIVAAVGKAATSGTPRSCRSEDKGDKRLWQPLSNLWSSTSQFGLLTVWLIHQLVVHCQRVGTYLRCVRRASAARLSAAWCTMCFCCMRGKCLKRRRSLKQSRREQQFLEEPEPASPHWMLDREEPTFTSSVDGPILQTTKRVGETESFLDGQSSSNFESNQDRMTVTVPTERRALGLKDLCEELKFSVTFGGLQQEHDEQTLARSPVEERASDELFPKPDEDADLGAESAIAVNTPSCQAAPPDLGPRISDDVTSSCVGHPGIIEEIAEIHSETDAHAEIDSPRSPQGLLASCSSVDEASIDCDCESSVDEDRQSADFSLEGLDMNSSWVDARSTVSDIVSYARHFCPSDLGFTSIAADRLASEGLALWRQCTEGHAADISECIATDSSRAVSGVVWALMREALRQSQGFEQGVFLVWGPGVEQLFFALFPYTYDRSSSHFSDTVIPLSAEDVELLPVGLARADARTRATRGSSHVGVDISPDGWRDLPAGKLHVVFGRIRQYDGSVAVYFKPEDYGFDLSSTVKVGEAARHAALYISSQVHRKFGDSREHDEGELKRKEYVPSKEKRDFFDLISAVRSEGPMLDDAAIHRYGLGEMARALRSVVNTSAHGQCVGAQDLLNLWQGLYGPSLDFRHGREVLIHTLDLLRDDGEECVACNYSVV